MLACEFTITVLYILGFRAKKDFGDSPGYLFTYQEFMYSIGITIQQLYVPAQPVSGPRDTSINLKVKDSTPIELTF